MGLADRDYQRETRYAAPPGHLWGAPATKWLLGLCVGIYFADMLLAGTLGISARDMPPIRREFCFAIESAFAKFRLWEFITFQFLHASIGHLLFNSIGLYFFGPMMERWWGTRRFVAFYLLCGAAGAFFFSLLTVIGVLPHGDIPLVGASAGIYGLLIGIAVIAPDARVQLLFPPVELSMRTFALALMGLAVLMIVTNWDHNAGGEAGHLGGAILGFVLVRWPWLLGKGARDRFRPLRSPAMRRRDERSSDLATTAEIDRILDKISHHGLHSLTAEERALLRSISGKHEDSSS